MSTLHNFTYILNERPALLTMAKNLGCNSDGLSLKHETLGPQVHDYFNLRGLFKTPSELGRKAGYTNDFNPPREGTICRFFCFTMPTNCGILVCADMIICGSNKSTHSSQFPAYFEGCPTWEQSSSTLMTMMNRIGVVGGYSVLMYTVNHKQVKEREVLEADGFSQVHSCTNKRSHNTISTMIKEI